MQAFILGFIAVAVYSLYIGIKSMVKLYRSGSYGKKLFWRYLIFFLLAPCIFSGGYYIIDENNPNIWLVAPLVLLAFVWFVIGFFIQSAYHNLDIKQQMTKPKEKAKNILLVSVSMFFIGLIIWIVGFTNGFLSLSDLWVDGLLVISLYLMFHGIMLFTRNFKFATAKPQPKKQANKQKHK